MNPGGATYFDARGKAQVGSIGEHVQRCEKVVVSQAVRVQDMVDIDLLVYLPGRIQILFRYIQCGDCFGELLVVVQ